MDNNKFKKNEFESNEFIYKQQNLKQKTMGWSVVSLVTGIISVICCCLGVTGILFGAAAIISAFISRKVLGYFDGLSIAGLVLGIFGTIFGLAIIVAINSLGEEFWDLYIEEFEKQYGNFYPIE